MLAHPTWYGTPWTPCFAVGASSIMAKKWRHKLKWGGMCRYPSQIATKVAMS